MLSRGRLSAAFLSAASAAPGPTAAAPSPAATAPGHTAAAAHTSAVTIHPGAIAALIHAAESSAIPGAPA
jgi:hypothetical protein